MPRKGITGHDGWVITEALATALVALEQLPPNHQPRIHMDEIKKLLVAASQAGTVDLHLAQAKCRLFPDVDRAAIYREYGLEDWTGLRETPVTLAQRGSATLRNKAEKPDLSSSPDI
jgi:hypothetical protein